MRRLFYILPISAAVILLLVGYKLTRPKPPPVSISEIARRINYPPPLFQLYDEHSQIQRLATYLGRHRMLVVFFDPQQGVASNPLLQQLRDAFPQLHEAGALVMAISDLRPSEHRSGKGRGGVAGGEAASPFPFHLLSDLDNRVRAQWGALDPETGKPLEAVFVIDRAGRIRQIHRGPDELGTAVDWVRDLNANR